MITCQDVYDELDVHQGKRNIRDWLRSRKHVIRQPGSEEQILIGIITETYPALVRKSKMIPAVIAQAEARGGIVVTGELPRGELRARRVDIPFVCEQRHVVCKDVTGLFGSLGWRFRVDRL